MEPVGIPSRDNELLQTQWSGVCAFAVSRETEPHEHEIALFISSSAKFDADLKRGLSISFVLLQ
jgi:hypothetical protein